MANHKKQFCPKGHDKEIVGRLGGQCRECRRDYQKIYNKLPAQRLAIKKWADANQDHLRDYEYRKVYGITLEDYNDFFTEQKGCCLVCSKHQNKVNKKLVVDHNHLTGKVRGLLCSTCNRAIGLLKDDPSLLRSAASYLDSRSK